MPRMPRMPRADVFEVFDVGKATTKAAGVATGQINQADFPMSVTTCQYLVANILVG